MPKFISYLCLCSLCYISLPSHVRFRAGDLPMVRRCAKAAANNEAIIAFYYTLSDFTFLEGKDHFLFNF